MKMIQKLNLWCLILLIGGIITITSCDDDDEPAALTVESITATGTDLSTGNQVEVDLNAATAPSDVPPDAVIEIVLSRAIDASTVNSSSITLSEGTTPLATTVLVNDNTITITPDNGMERGTDYSLTLTGDVRAEDGGLFTQAVRTFSTDGRAEVTAPNSSSQLAYWKFDGDATDAVGNYDADAEIAIDYQADRFGAVGSAAYFDGDASIIEVPNAGALLNDSESFTVSFWLKTDTDGHVNENGDPTGMFVFGLGAFYGIQYEIFGSYDGSKFAISYENEAGDQFGEDMWFPSGATDNTTGGWQGWDFAQNLTPEQMQAIIKDTWYHVVYTYNAPQRQGLLYFNGDLMKSFDFDLWPDGDLKQNAAGVTYRGTAPEVVDDLAFGFIHSREGTLFDSEPWGNYDVPTSQHFKGWLDDFRIFNAPFSAADVEALYDAENP